MSDEKYSPDRRPINSRNHPLAIQTASWLAQRGATPNGISTAGMIAGIAGGLCFWGTSSTSIVGDWAEPVCFILAALCMQLRLQANMYDGMVAIQTKQASPVGELYNEVPDRVSDTAFLVGAGYAAGGIPELGYLAAIAAMFTAYVRAEGKVAGAPQEYCGPMAKQHRMAVLTVAALYAALAPKSWQPDFPSGGVISIALFVIVVLGGYTTVRRLTRTVRKLKESQGIS